ncbi:MAG: hypothetical protein IJK59_02900, partial [Firmicutes bacterium]|nr:hypothetical protein [Bacillota bacterium]
AGHVHRQGDRYGKPLRLFQRAVPPGLQRGHRRAVRQQDAPSGHDDRERFRPIDCEWWHFTLKDEPYPDTYFEFPLSVRSLKR